VGQELAETGRISTAHGEISYWDHAARGAEIGVPVLFVHGNSACKEMFDRQEVAPFAEGRRLIAVDLPGHGQSDNAIDPVATYAVDGFADAVLAVLKTLDIKRAVLVGWSLGGHIVLQMAAEWPGVCGVAIVGTPPLGADPDDFAAAFLPSEHMELTFKPEFSTSEAEAYAQEAVGVGLALKPWMVDAAKRADGRFRSQMLAAAMAGRGHDQKEVAATLAVPLAVMHGSEDPFISLAYLKKLSYRNLWRGKVQEFDGTGHAPFWEEDALFNALLAEFLKDVD